MDVSLIELLRTIIKARKAGLLRLRPATGAVRLDCLAEKCGLCCKVLGSGIVVTPQDALSIPSELLATRGNSGTLMKSCGSTCAALASNLCSIHARRPRGCREYPFYNVGGLLHFDQGCPGIKHDLMAAPAADGLTPIEAYLPMPNWVKKIVIGVMRKW